MQRYQNTALLCCKNICEVSDNIQSLTLLVSLVPNGVPEN